MNLLRKNQSIMHLCINITLLLWLGWLRGLAFAQVGQAFTGSANFSTIQLACIGNSAAFIQLILRGKLWFEKKGGLKMWPLLWRPLLGGPMVKKIKGGLKMCGEDQQWKCDVVMLSNQREIVQKGSFMPLMFMPVMFMQVMFMQVMFCNYDVQSIILACLPLKSVHAEVTVEMCTEYHGEECGCIVFETQEDITVMLARRMPGTVKKLHDSRILLPSLGCLRNGCHGCNQGLLNVDENDRLREGDPQLESPAAVCEILDLESIQEAHGCICIPMCSANADEWTNQLIRFFEPDTEELRGAVTRKGKTTASSALENYKKGNQRNCNADEKYSLASLTILPRLTLVLIMLLLTFWLKVDGFSTTMFAYKAVANYLSMQASMYSPHSFLSRALVKSNVKSNANKISVCQVLFFRGNLQRCAAPSLLEALVADICIISWTVLVATEGGANKWFHTHSMAPSTARVAVILVGLCIALAMDFADLSLYLKIRRMPCFKRCINRITTLAIYGTIILEILCIVACSAIAVVKAYGRWIYSALQCLALVKFLMGDYLVTQIRGHPLSGDSEIREHPLSGDSVEDGEPPWWYGSCGLYMQSSAILLNAILAGVRAKWEWEFSS